MTLPLWLDDRPAGSVGSGGGGGGTMGVQFGVDMVCSLGRGCISVVVKVMSLML